MEVRLSRKMQKKVVDACFLLRSNLDFSDRNYYTTHEVLEEIKEEIKKAGIDAAVSKGFLKIKEPSKDSIAKVEAMAKKTGDFKFLSKADISLIALALDLKALVISDDYAIQNVCNFLGLAYKGFLQKSIEKKIRWRFVCKGCKKYFREYKEKCDVCGSKISKIKN